MRFFNSSPPKTRYKHQVPKNAVYRWGLFVCAVGLYIPKIDKLHWFSVSCFHLGGMELCLGAKPTKAPVATELTVSADESQQFCFPHKIMSNMKKIIAEICKFIYSGSNGMKIALNACFYSLEQLIVKPFEKSFWSWATFFGENTVVPDFWPLTPMLVSYFKFHFLLWNSKHTQQREKL